MSKEAKRLIDRIKNMKPAQAVRVDDPGIKDILDAAQKAAKSDVERGLLMLMMATIMLAEVNGSDPQKLAKAFKRMTDAMCEVKK